MITITRDLTARGAEADALVSITCDRCGATAPESGRCDPDDASAARILADWLRYRCGWGRAGRRLLCPDCRPRRRPRD